MKSTGKSLSLLLILLLTISIGNLSLRLTSAQSIPTPSVPEFTVTIVEHPYNESNYIVENQTIEFMIKNQPFSYSFNGTTYALYYNTSFKEVSDEYWSISSPFPAKNDSQYSIVSIATRYNHGAHIEAKVQAMVGHIELVLLPNFPGAPGYGESYYPIVRIDKTGDESSIQTISIPADKTSLNLTIFLEPLAIILLIILSLIIAIVYLRKYQTNKQSFL
jgi:hypothetical protein